MTTRLKFWQLKSINDKRARPIFAFLLSRWLREVREQKREVVFPELRNGRYRFQEILNYKRSLELPKVGLNSLRIFIP